jgi:hypothetical protein
MVPNLDIPPEHQPLALARAFRAGVESGRTAEKAAWIELLAKQQLQTFSDPPERKPARAFMHVFTKAEKLADYLAEFFPDDDYPDGLPRHICKHFGMPEDEFGERSGRELFEVSPEEPGRRVAFRWLDPSTVQDLPPHGEEFADRSRLRRVQITTKNGVRRHYWIDPSKEGGEGGGAAAKPTVTAKTDHPDNAAKPTADYHPTAEAEQRVAAAIQNPSTIKQEQLAGLFHDFDTLQRVKLQALAREMKLKVSGKKMEIIERLLDRLRGLTEPSKLDKAAILDELRNDVAGLDTADIEKGPGPRGREPKEEHRGGKPPSAETPPSSPSRSEPSKPSPTKKGAPTKKTNAATNKTGSSALDILKSQRNEASPLVQEHIDSALHNADPKDERQVARSLVREWLDLQSKKASETDIKPFEDAMEAHGMRKIGEPGEKLPFSGDRHEGPAGSFTKDAHEVVTPGWEMERPDGGVYVVSKAQTKPVGKAKEAGSSGEPPTKPVITYRTNGDGSTTARIVLPNGNVEVHSNKNRRVLEKLVHDRYIHSQGSVSTTWPTAG